MAPATADRSRAILVAALRYGARGQGLMPPEILSVKRTEGERLVFLTPAETRRLLAAYRGSARDVATVLAYQGFRTQEALRLDWRHINWKRREILVTGTSERGKIRTKTMRARTVPMHRIIRVVLYLIWRTRGRPQFGPVFLTHLGRPYADTRSQGGQPMKTAHKAACRRAGISNFRVHDWRHSWAANMVMSGCDLPTLMRLGGWTTLRMVQRYTAVSTEHMADAIRRLA
jgi:integrase